MAEYGKFDISGVHIDIHRNISEHDVVATSLHELTHQILASETSIGKLDFLLMSIYNAENDEKIKKRMKRLYERVAIRE